MPTPALLGVAPDLAAPLVLAALAAVATALLWRPVLMALPEPVDPAKVPYRTLAGGRHALVAAGCVAAACTGLAWVPRAAWPAWAGLATIGIALAVVDARTTWLPLRLTHALWAAAVAGVAVLAVTSGWRAAALAAAAAAASGTFFWLVWRLTGGLGFGDVRLAPVVGAAAGSVSVHHAAAALLLGTLLGALVGLARLALGRRGPFAYGPALVAGPWLAVAALAWLP